MTEKASAPSFEVAHRTSAVRRLELVAETLLVALELPAMTGTVGRQCKSYPNRTYDEQAKIARCQPQEQFAVHAPRPVVPLYG